MAHPYQLKNYCFIANITEILQQIQASDEVVNMLLVSLANRRWQDKNIGLVAICRILIDTINLQVDQWNICSVSARKRI
jgi:hypothetical protein